MECEQQLELPQDSAPQTEITELTDSLTEAIKKETEAESRVITAQKEYDLSVEAVNTKEALVVSLFIVYILHVNLVCSYNNHYNRFKCKY